MKYTVTCDIPRTQRLGPNSMPQQVDVAECENETDAVKLRDILREAVEFESRHMKYRMSIVIAGHGITIYDRYSVRLTDENTMRDTSEEQKQTDPGEEHEAVSRETGYRVCPTCGHADYIGCGGIE